VVAALVFNLINPSEQTTKNYPYHDRSQSSRFFAASESADQRQEASADKIRK